MQWTFLLILFFHIEIALSAELKGAIVRISGTRFFAGTIQGKEIFIPTDELLSENERIARSFCRNHLQDNDVIELRKSEISIQNENVLKLLNQCSLNKDNVPRKKDSPKTDIYSHRNAESYKSIIDYIMKK